MFVFEFFRVLLKHTLERRLMRQTTFKIILLIVSILLLFQIYKNLTIPNTVGIENNKFKPLKNSPNGVSSQASDGNQRVSPLEMPASLSEAKKKIKDLILSYENTQLIKATDNYLHFVFTTKFFHFKDDVEFYFDSESNIIEVKSQSRIGYSDMGTNRERYEMIKQDFKE